jgi:hypothetical protein
VIQTFQARAEAVHMKERLSSPRYSGDKNPPDLLQSLLSSAVSWMHLLVARFHCN